MALLCLWIVATPSTARAQAPENQEGFGLLQGGESITSESGAVIDNGPLSLGVNQEGHLNYDEVGLGYWPPFDEIYYEAIYVGCPCEGWGAADGLSGVSGHANSSDGVTNIVVSDFAATDDTATSMVQIGETFSVTHDFAPSTTSALFRVDVTIENISDTAVSLLYRRVMDWDIPPTEFDEYVTIDAGDSPAIAFTSDNGFATADPLVDGSSINATGSFEDDGPDDHGALFDLDFGALAPGEVQQFTLFYGGTESESDAVDALAEVGAEAYSFGQPNTEHGPSDGEPNTFIFALSDIGGSALFDYEISETIDPDEGGVLISDDGEVSVSFSGGAVSETIVVTYTRFAAASDVPGTLKLAGNNFDISAATTADGTPVTTFAKPFILTLHYNDADWQAAGLARESDLNLYFHDGTGWTPILPCAGCSLDTVNNTLTVELDHLTLFGEGDAVQPGPILHANATDSDDDGDCSFAHCTLVEAILLANVTPAITGITLTTDAEYELTEEVDSTEGDNGLPSITSTITITGNGATVTRDTSYSCPGVEEPEFRIFHVGATGILNLVDMTLDNGCANGPDGPDGDGGAILAHGPLTLRDVNIQNSYARGDGGGVNADDTLEISGGTIGDNSALEFGGGIYVTSTATIVISGTAIMTNTSVDDGGGVYARSMLDLQNSEVISNTSGGEGGGVMVLHHATVSNTSFISNTAADSGGGLYAIQDATIRNVEVVANVAVTDGAGIFLTNESTLSGSIFVSNTTGDDGGGLWANESVAITDTTFMSNTAGDFGGGIFAVESILLEGVDFVGNRSVDDGGGLHVDADLTVRNSSFISNTTLDDGGGFSSGTWANISNTTFISNTAADAGGGARTLGGATIDGSTFRANHSTNDGGALASLAATTVTGTVFHANTSGNDGGALYAEGVLSLLDVAAESNDAAGDGGGVYAASGAVEVTRGLFGLNTSGDKGAGLYASSTVVVTDTRFMTNSAETGGGAYVVGVATFRDSLFQKNEAVGTETGGGLFAEDDVILDNTDFIANESDGDAGGAYVGGKADIVDSLFRLNEAENNGGGLYVSSTLSISNTEFVLNEAFVDDGGGLVALSRAAMTNTTFLTNTASGNGGGARIFDSAALLGGLFQANEAGAKGGGLFTDLSADVDGTHFVDNYADSYGGGQYAASSASIQDALFRRNEADSRGGGLAADGPLTVDNTHFISNTSYILGGGIWLDDVSQVSNGYFAGNDASGGGGIFAMGVLSVTNSTFYSNTTSPTEGSSNGGGLATITTTVVLGGSFQDNETLDDGGGIYVGATDASLTISGTTFISNTADDGGGISSDGSLAATNISMSGNRGHTSGGAIEDRGPASTLAGSDLSHNYAGTDGGAIYFAGGAFDGSLIISTTTLYSNTAHTGAGGGIWNGSYLTVDDSRIERNNSFGNGGGVFNEEDTTTATFRNGTVVADNRSRDAIGGGIYSENDTTTTVENSAVSLNWANETGGGIEAHDDLIVVSSVISGNIAVEGGGGIATTNRLEITGTQLLSNTVTDTEGGGAILAFGSAYSIITNTLVAWNSAFDYGGGIYNEDGTLLIWNSEITSNSVSPDGSDGGGIMSDTGLAYVKDSAISHNYAPGSGGGIANSALLEIENTTVTNNEADGSDGGGIWSNATFTATNSTISGNTAGGDGGGVMEYPGGGGETTYLHHSTVTDNSADGDGGGVVNAAGAVYLDHAIIAGNTDTTAATFRPDVSGLFTSIGHNLIGNGDGSIGLTHGVDDDQVGSTATTIDAKLATLTDNGGETRTHALLAGSPAIDQGDPAFSAPPSTDQRGAGFPRILGVHIDVGAYEASTFEIVATLPTSPTLVGIAVDAPVSATFSAEVDASTLNTQTFTVFGDESGLLPGVYDYDSLIDSSLFTATEEFHFGETVNAVATNGVGSTGGASLTPYQWQFTAGGASDRCFAGFRFASEISGSLSDMEAESVAWGDYDQDGDLDIVAINNDVIVYRNDGAGAFTALAPLNSSFEGGSGYGHVDWVDIDADGDLDVFAVGETGPGETTIVFVNNGGDTFSEVPANPGVLGSFGIPNFYGPGGFAWGDYDNDGDLDLLVGAYSETLGDMLVDVLRNDLDTVGTFVATGAGFAYAIDVTSSTWADYDNDGDLDALIMGLYEEGAEPPELVPQLWLYRNDNGDFTEVNPAGFPELNGYAAWGDYDADGDLDVVLSGLHGSTEIYRNDVDSSGGFTGEGTEVFLAGPVDWGDFDNDGDLDVLLTDVLGGPLDVKILRNDNGAITAVDVGIAGVDANGAFFGDVDDDGDLDVLLSGWGEAALYLNEDCADLTVSKSVSSTFTRPGSPVTYTIAVSNPTATVAYNLVVTDITPAEVDVSGFVTSGVDFVDSGASPAFVWTAEEIAPFSIGYITVTGTISDELTASATVINTATVVATNDITETNNHDSASLSVSVPSAFFGPSSYSVSEAAGAVLLRVNLTTPNPHADVTVVYSTTAGSAVDGVDFVGVTGVLTIPAGSSFGTFVVVLTADDIFDPGKSFTVGLSDPVGGGLSSPSSAVVTILDDDSPGVTVSAITTDTTEAGGAATFTAVLASEPTATVTITLASGDPSEGTVDPATLVFTPTTWNVAQTATVTGVDDDVEDGDAAYTIETTTVSDDTDYDGVSTTDVPVTNLDDDSAGVTVSTISTDTTEAGGTATFTVVLDSEPTDTVTVTLSSDDTGEGTVDPAALVFTPTVWNVVQTATVTGVDDEVEDGDQGYTIQTVVASDDEAYDGASADDVTVTNLDDDTAGVSVGEISADTTEAGGTATFTVVLDSEPTGTVTVTLSSDDTSEGTVDPATLVFTPTVWNVIQTATVTGVNDDVDDGDQPFSIVTTLSSNDGKYSPINPTDVAVTNEDDDGAGVSVGEISADTTEAGGTATFTVVLDSEPTSTVTITLSSDDTGEGTVDPATLVFTPTVWNVIQTATVTGIDDDVEDGDQGYTIQTVVTSDDEAFDGASADDVAVTNLDDDTAGVSVGEISADTTEAGGTATFTVVLDSEPTSTVTITLSSDDTGEGTVDPATLVFTPTVWNVVQTATVTGVDDDVEDGDQGYAIQTDVTSDDQAFDGASADDVAVTNLDDDTAGVSVGEISMDTTEAGGTATFTVVLESEPTSTVTVTMSSDDTTEGTVNPATLVFTPTTWNVVHVATVTGVNDEVDDGDQVFTIVTTLSSDDGKYSPINPADVAVTNEDDDGAGVTVSAVSADTTEAGGTATFTVVLDSEPTSTVTVTLSSDDTSEGMVAPSTLVFTPTNWNVVQTATVTGVDDDVEDGDQGYTIQTVVTSDDEAYDGTSADDVAVTNLDNDAAGVSVGEISADTTEAGGTATFTVVLDSEPTSTVTVTLSSDDTGEGTVDPATLVFTPTVWNVIQTATVTGVDDDVDDGDQDYAIETSVASDDEAYDEAYDGASADDVAVTNLDDDTAGVSVGEISMDTTEAGGTATFTVVLDSEPTATVTVTLSSDDTSEGTVAPSTLVFTPTVWNTAKTATVTGVNDNLDDGDQGYNIVTTVSSNDGKFSPINPADVAVTNLDDDTAGVTVSAISTNTTEAGGTANFTVVLESEPTSTVTITVVSTDTTEGIATPNTLVFTPTVWNVAQTATVTGQDDDGQDGDRSYAIATFLTSDDGVYAAIDPANVAVTNLDDDMAGIVVSTISNQTTEAGVTATFTMVLDSQPADAVTVTLVSTDTTEGTVSPSTLVFTPTNWNFPQTATVTGVNDNVDDGDIAFNIVTAAISDPNVTLGQFIAPNDANYDDIPTADVSVTNQDDDTAGVTVSTISTNTTEANTTATFTTVLQSEPTATVTITLTSSDLTEGAVAPSSLIFTPLNWHIAQTATVTGWDEDIDDGDIAYSIVTTVTSDDSLYNGIAAADVSVINIDDDTIGYIISDVSTNTTEAGAAASFTMRLTSEPTGNVVIDVVSSDAGEGTAAPAMLTFTDEDWHANRTVTITGQNDDADDGDQAYAILLTVNVAGSSDTSGYKALDPSDPSVTNLDDDSAGVTVTESDGSTNVDENGPTSDSYTIALDTVPTATVEITVESDGQSEVSLDGATFSATVVFSRIDKSIQTISVRPLDDKIVESTPHTSTVNHRITGVVGDPKYHAGLSIAPVLVGITDDDVATVTVSRSAVAISEDGVTDSYTVVLGSEPTSPVTVTAAPANAQIDLGNGAGNAISLTLDASNWSTPLPVTVAAVDDGVSEGAHGSNISHGVSSADPVYAGLAAPISVTVAITDNDGSTLGIADASANEDSGSLQFTVTLTGATSSGFTVDYVAADIPGALNGASAGIDYTAISGTLNFGGVNGETQLVNVPLTVDAQAEPDEIMRVTLSDVQAGGINVALVYSVASGTILNDDAVPPCISPPNPSWPVACGLSLAASSVAGSDGLAASAVTDEILVGEVEQSIDQTGQSKWYKFDVEPSSKLIVELTNLPANYDLTLYKDISSTFDSMLSTQTNDDLTQLGAEFAPDAFSPDAFSPDAFSPDAFSPDAFSPDAFSPDAFSPDAFSPDAFSPDAFSPDAFSPDAFSPDAFSPDAFSPDAFSPDAFSPDAFSPDAFSPDAFSPDAFSPDAFSGAQTRSLVAASAFDGTASEGIIVNTWENNGDYYLRVKGRNGAFAPGQNYHLKVTMLTGGCGNVSSILPLSTHPVTAGAFKTIILADYGRMTGSAAEVAAMQAKLNELAARTEVAGVVVDVGTDARIAQANAQADANPECPFAKNLVAESIKQLIDAYSAINPLEYVVVVGSDNVIPFFRHPDQASLANERNYVPPVKDSTSSQASLKLGYVLGQDKYGADVSISYNDSTLPIPKLAVGRLVESTGEIIGMVDAYLSTTDGVAAAPVSSLVTGYDFLEDAALAVQAELEAGIGNPANTLIAQRDWAPTDPRSWTGAQMADALLSQRHDLIFLAGHFSASSALAADYSTRLLASTVASSLVDLKNAIIFSAGCHSGYNIVDEHGVPFVTVEPDWANAFAQKQATFIGGTGYQYGDTDFIEYGERLYKEFAQQLRLGQGPVAVGKALASAKREYLAETGTMRPIHEKSILEATLFGLPMLKVNMPTGRGDPATEPSVVGSTTEFATNPGATLELNYFDLTVFPTLAEHTVTLTDAASGNTADAFYLSGQHGVVSNPAEPVLPLERRNVTVSNTVLRGVGFRGGEYKDTPDIFPLTGAATTEIRGVHPIFISDVFYPVRPWQVNYFGALSGGPTWLAALPAQYRSKSSESLEGTLRQFSRMDYRLYYSNNTDSFNSAAFGTQIIPALAAAPDIPRVIGVTDGDNVKFDVTVLGHPAAGIQEVWVTYTELNPDESQLYNGVWQSINLTQNLSNTTRWEGVLPLNGKDPTKIRYMVQAVNGVGLVALNTNLGEFFQPDVDPGSPSQGFDGDDSQAALTALTWELAPTQGAYGTTTTFRVKLVSQGNAVANATVRLAMDAQSLRSTTDAGGVAQFNGRLLGIPRTFDVVASYAGSPEFKPTTAATTFTVVKQNTVLTVAETSVASAARGYNIAADVSIPVIIATLVDAEQRPLSEKTVIFIIYGPDNNAYSVPVITDYAGRAYLDLATLQTDTLPSGIYTVVAQFSGAITLTTGEVLTLSDDRYNPVTQTADFNVVGDDPGGGEEHRLFVPLVRK